MDTKIPQKHGALLPYKVHCCYVCKPAFKSFTITGSMINVVRHEKNINIVLYFVKEYLGRLWWE